MPKRTTSTFVGIRNEREFYSDHYLAEILSKDLRPTLKRWLVAADSSEEDVRSPEDRLRSLWKHYGPFRERFDKPGTGAPGRLKAQEEWHRRPTASGIGWTAGQAGQIRSPAGLRSIH